MKLLKRIKRLWELSDLEPNKTIIPVIRDKAQIISKEDPIDKFLNDNKTTI